MWLWIVCHRPALLPPVTMLRTLSLRLGPAPAPEQAPPPPSLAHGEGPAPPCPPLSAAPLIDTVRPTGNKETRTHGQKKRERERTRWTEDETDVQVGQQNKEVSKIRHRGGKRHRQGFGSSHHECPVYTKTRSKEVSSALGGNKTLQLTPKLEQENFFLQQMQQMLTSVHRLNQFYPVKC